MRTEKPRLIRLAHPLAFAAFLEHVGAPVDGYFRRQGLPALCRDPGVYVPLGRAWALFDDAARREGEDVAWHVGRFIGDNPLSAALLNELRRAPTLYQALQRFIALVNSEASHLRLGIIEGKHHVLFYNTGYFHLKDEPGFSCSQAYQLELYTALIREFAGNDWRPQQMGVCASSVPAVVERHFPECNIRLQQPFSYIAIPRAILQLPTRSKNTPVADPEQIVLTRDLNSAEALSLMIRPYLPLGYPTIRFAASLVDTSARTLSRRLAECGTSYRALVDEIRFDRACALLRGTDLPIRDIAAASGFEDQGNFSRFFRRVSGLRPHRFRQASLGQASPEAS